MLIRRLILYLQERLTPSPELVGLAQPVVKGEFKLSDIFDGFLLVQKRKRNIRVRWRKLYGDDNWRFGTKLWKPKKNITTCGECGSFHEFHTICRVCFGKTKKVTEERLLEGNETEGSWFEPNVAQPKNVVAGRETAKVIKET